MHELSLAHSVVELVEQAAATEHFTRAHRIVLEIGVLSCVQPEALHLAFASATMGTCAEGAELELIMVPGEGACPRCGLRQQLLDDLELCPQCGTTALEVLSGTQMRVKDLLVD